MLPNNTANPFRTRLEKDLASKMRYQDIEALHLKLLFSPEEEPIEKIREFERLTEYFKNDRKALSILDGDFYFLNFSPNKCRRTYAFTQC